MAVYYNRWGWALFLPLALMALRPPERGLQIFDGVLFGFGLALLALLKMTYFATLAPIILISLLHHRRFTALGLGAVVGVAVAGLVTAFLGFDYWLAYLRDLLEVATSEGRSQPARSLQFLLVAPAYLPGTLILILSVIVLRLSGKKSEGLLLFLLAPCLLYATYQNWDNAPVWLVLVGVLLIVLSGEVWERRIFWTSARGLLFVFGIACLSLSAPSAVNHTLSPIRNMSATSGTDKDLVPIIEGQPDLLIKRERAWEWLEERPANADEEEHLTFAGRTVAECNLTQGYVGQAQRMAERVKIWSAGSDRSIMTIGTVDDLWLFGGLKATQDAHLWYYGGTASLEAAEYFALPACPVSMRGVRLMIEAMNEAGWLFREVLRDDLLTIYERVR
jgi:hypothetical protein